MTIRRSTAAQIYTLRVELQDIQPLIWRRLQVPTGIALTRLHDVLQVAMGWTDSHLHSFKIGAREFTNADDPLDDLDELKLLPEKGRKLDALLGKSTREFNYLYDFGDSWDHRIVIEAIAPAQPDWSYPLCVAGARACPPDDVGGAHGYHDFLVTLADPSHEEHDSMLVWIGGAFDPEGFDINSVNRELRRRRL